MGREWHWSRSLSRQEKESPGCMSGMFHYFDFHHLHFTTSSRTVPPELSSKLRHPTSQLKGIEAPRNSLELDEGKASSTLAIAEEYYDVPVGRQVVPKPAAVTRRSKMVTLLEEERRRPLAETPRTPGVVARLMGLDVLPEQASYPTTSCQKSPPLVESQEQTQKKKKKLEGECKRKSVSPRQPLQSINCNVAGGYEEGSRSLPATPRVSSARSWDSDPRLSLQLNKENTNRAMQDFTHLCAVFGDLSLSPSPLPSVAKSRKKDLGRIQNESKSPRSHYHAREIVKQVKGSFSNRKGGSSDDIAVRSEQKASCHADTWSQSKPPITDPAPSCSPPRVRFLEPVKSKSVKDLIPRSQQPQKFTHPRSAPPSLPSSGSFISQGNVEAKAVRIGPSKCKKASYERFTGRIKKTHPASETAGRLDALSSHSQPASVPQKHLSEKKCRSIPSFVTVKRREASPPPSRPVPEQNHQCPSSSVQELQMMTCGVEGALMPLKIPRRRLPKERDPEYRYLRSILDLAGVTGVAIPSFRWYSSSLPIDPIIFHQLELKLPSFSTEEGQPQSKSEEEATLLGSLRHRWNRKLLFHLVEEILADLLGCSYLTDPTTRQSHLIKRQGMERHDKADGGLLLRELWRQIRSFPAADCQVVGDIDALVAGDMPEAKIRRLLLHPSVVEEAGDIALEVEREIFDGLLGEAAASLALASRGT